MDPINEKLKSLLDKKSMQVPDGYFERLEHDILSNINNDEFTENTIKKQPPIIKRLFIFTAVAATITIAFFSVNWLVKSNANDAAVAFANMSDLELDNYMNQQIASLSIDDLYGYLIQNVNQLNTEVLFNSTYSDASQIDKSITGDLHEQVLDSDVLNAVMESSQSDNDGKLLETVDDELLQEYLNDATLFENLGL